MMKMKATRYWAMILCTVILISSCKKDYDDDNTGPPPGPPGPPPIVWDKAADSSTKSLNQKFWNASGQYFNETNASTGFNYWPQAHALDVLVDAYLRTGDAVYKDFMDQWFIGVRIKNGNTFLNEFYDDMGWNALAMLRAYNATNDVKWKTAAEVLWADIKTGWNQTMGGGIAWRKSMPWYKNTPANGPAAILAARLYKVNNNADDLLWAKKIYTWLKDSLYNNNTGWVYDGINSENDGVRNTTWKFTYNQGLFIGAATELYGITNDAGYLNNALKTANFTLSDNVLTNFADNLLRDEGGGDGGLFKGVLVRYLTQLIMAPGMVSTDKKRYAGFLEHNAETLWTSGTDKVYLLYGSYWKNRPAATTDLTIQLSGAMLIEALALLEEKELL
jgi:predicted alpha-1,6-mannanase (GH76 family)